jgi:tRNA-Thr(GGU) m(6)t(6)A37 methyltransferase TsaA
MVQLSKLEETRAAERKGRIRAEMKLRTQLKKEVAHSNPAESNDDEGGNENDASAIKHNLQLHCIGVVVSPFTKRMGTPRQGALVPSGRGYIQLRIPVECVEGLDLYSHAWILFTFHANTDTPSVITKNSTDNSQTLNLTKTKIRPPRGNGIKVGMLATRSPHRPNNIGLSLVQIVKVDKKEKRLHIAAFDLVNGTPVYGECIQK